MLDRQGDSTPLAQNASLKLFQFLGSGAGKTLVGTIYDWDGLAIKEATLTIGTTARQANYQYDTSFGPGSQGNGPGLWTATSGGAVLPWDDKWAGFVVDTASTSVYVKESKGVTVTATNGRTVANGMPIGVVPQRFYDAFYGPSGGALDAGYVTYLGKQYAIQHAFASPSSSGHNSIVAAQGAGLKIAVIGYSMIANGTVTAYWEDGTTAITGNHYLAANTGINKDLTGKILWQGTANTALQLNLSGAVAVGLDVWYIVI